MSRLLVNEYDIECPWCHGRFSVHVRLVGLGRWLRKLKHCVFCGHDLAITEEEMVTQGYMKDEPR